MLWAPELHTILQVGSYASRAEGKNHVPQSAGHGSFDASFYNPSCNPPHDPFHAFQKHRQFFLYGEEIYSTPWTMQYVFTHVHAV